VSQLQLHNTLTRRKERFEPADPGHVRMYVCGPTVYDYAHIGNARPVVVFDVLARLLRRLYPRVSYVRNITDVDDKIMAAAAANGEPIETLTDRTARQFHADMAALNALPPDIEPRATQHIGQMIALIQRLIASGHAYEADGHALFHVPAMAGYGKLSGRSREEQIAGARVDVAPYKRDPADFVLWKPSDPGQPGWDSPWGRGRPGWHIECSAMAETHLSPLPFDIHGGGLDLIFPHHENEIAQSECAHAGSRFANYWVHNGFVTVEEEKMSKSLGNFFTVHDLLQDWPGEAIRLALLSAHYRQPLDFTRDGLRQAKQTLDRWYGALRAEEADVEAATIPAEIVEALSDDLNTPLAITHLHELATALNKAGADSNWESLAGAMIRGGSLLGLLQQSPEDWFRWQPPAAALPEAEIENLLTQRAAARKTRNFAEADRIRTMLSEKGIVLEDSAAGTSWKRAG
jgi:cysteinyl-tRNA synthetase